MSSKNSSIVYFENLDGVRFFAFLLVFLTHSFYTENTSILNSNWYHILNKPNFADGVMVFYTLSGFLITFLLLTEEKIAGKIHIGKFYLRRILRIWPLYYLMVAYGFVIVPIIKHFMGLPHVESAQLWYYLLLLPNYSIIYDGIPDSVNLHVLWSIGVEEQFYLLWPILLVLFQRQRWLMLGCVVVFSALFRIYYLTVGAYEYAWQHTFSNIFFMAVGAIGAMYAFHFPDRLRNLFIKSRFWNLAIYAFFSASYLILLYSTGRLYLDIKAFLASIFALYVILEQEYSSESFFKFKRLRPTLFLGGISYGLYCYHTIVITTIDIFFIKVLKLDNLVTVAVSTPILSLLLTVLVAYTSYKWLEAPILRYKDKFAYVRKHA